MKQYMNISVSLFSRKYILFLASLVVFIFGESLDMQGSHLIGNEISYRCLGNSRYEIRLVVRRDCNNANEEAVFDNPAALFMYDGNGVPVRIGGKDQILYLHDPTIDTLDTRFSQGCEAAVADLCVEEAVYIDTVTLVRRPGGYQLMYQRCCRNEIINNIIIPDETGMSVILRITDAALELCNNSPRFNSFPDEYICLNSPFTHDHGAIDPDGDSIVFSFCVPPSGASKEDPNPDAQSGIAPNFPVPPVVWNSPTFDVAYLFGNQSDPLTIDPQTGFMEGFPRISGTYLIAVCAEEYRNGILMSQTIREFEVTAVSCAGLPIADFEPSGVYCKGLDVPFENLSQNASFYTWFFDLDGNQSATSNEENPTYTYQDTGAYNVMLIATEDSICYDTIVKPLILRNTGLIVDFNVQANECTDTFEIELTDLSSDSISTIVDRTWILTFSDTTIMLSGLNPILRTTRSGEVEVRLLVTAANGCIDEKTETINLQQIELSLLGDSLSICLGESTFLLQAGFDPNLSYTWRPDTFLRPSNTSPNPEAKPRESITYFVSATDGLCLIEDSVYIEVRGEDFTIIDLTTDPCDSFSHLVIEGVPYDSVLWSFTDDFTSIESRQDTFSVFVEDELRIYARIFSAELNCVIDSFIDLKNEGIRLSYPDSLLFCTGDTVTYTVINLDEDVPVSIRWESNDIIIGSLNGPTIQLLSTDTMVNVPFLVFTATNDTGCIVSDTIHLEIIETLEADFTIERECGRLIVQFGNANQSGMWLWDFGDGSTSMALNPSHTYDTAGTYTITLSSLDACMSFISKEFYFNFIDVELEDTIRTCANRPVALNPGGNEQYTYNWSPAGPLDDPTSANPIATVDQTTQFTVQIQEESDTCVLELSVLVIVEPIFELDASDLQLCEGDTVTLTATPLIPGTDISWSWTPTSSIIDDPTSATVRAIVNANTTFTVVGTTADGCEETQSISISVFTLSPDVVATADPETIMFGDETQLNVENGDPNWMYRWTPGGSLSDSTIINPVAKPKDTTKYIVFIRDDSGCEFMRMVTVNVQQPACEPPYVFLPNAFSPNGDNVNDELMIFGEFITSVELIIYDRWGQKVFETTDVNFRWDGTTRGELNQPGGYGYLLRVECEGGGMHEEKGSISLLR